MITLVKKYHLDEVVRFSNLEAGDTFKAEIVGLPEDNIYMKLGGGCESDFTCVIGDKAGETWTSMLGDGDIITAVDLEAYIIKGDDTNESNSR